MTLKITASALFVACALQASPLSAEGRPQPPSERFNKAWQQRAPRAAVAPQPTVFEQRESTRPIVMRLHRAADQYVVLARALDAREKAQLLTQGFRMVDRLEKARDRTIFEDDAYVGYPVVGLDTDQLAALVSQRVSVRFKAYQGAGASAVAVVELVAADK